MEFMKNDTTAASANFINRVLNFFRPKKAQNGLIRVEGDLNAVKAAFKDALSETIQATQKSASDSSAKPVVLKHGQAMRVVFHFPDEESTYVDAAMVTLFESGIVHIRSQNEETTTHLQHCEVMWRYETDESAQVTPFRVIRNKDKNSPVSPDT